MDTNRALYDGLLQRFKEIGVAGGVGINNISVVDPADVPQVPSSPRRILNLLIALVVGLGLGGLAAFVLEQLDEAIADPAEVERRLGLPLLGSVPKVGGETPKEALLDRKSNLVDAYLAVQTNLAFTTEHGVPRSFAVTSTRPAEGKSTTALALATMLARSGRNVILIDGDMRSPSVHELGGVNHDRGVSNFLAGDDAIETMTFAMNDLGFTAMSAGDGGSTAATRFRPIAPACPPSRPLDHEAQKRAYCTSGDALASSWTPSISACPASMLTYWRSALSSTRDRSRAAISS